MKKNKPIAQFTYIIMSCLLMSYSSYAQEDPYTPEADIFYDELNNLKAAFVDTTNTDTLKFTTAALSEPSSFIGYEILNSDQVRTLIDDYNLTIDEDDNNVLLETSVSFTYDGKSYDKRHSYSVERKNFNKTVLDNVYYSNLFCLHIIEMITITSDELPTPIDVKNNYYVIYEPSNTDVQAIIAYSEMFSERHLITDKYFDVTNSAAKPSGIYHSSISLSNMECITITPNPAKTLLKLDVMLRQEGDATVSVIDMTGKMVKKIELGRLKAQVTHSISEDISDLPNGIYGVTLFSPHTIKTVKLVITK